MTRLLCVHVMTRVECAHTQRSFGVQRDHVTLTQSVEPSQEPPTTA